MITPSSLLAISNERLAMHYQLPISNVGAFNREWLIDNVSQMANRQSIMISEGGRNA